MGCGKLAADSKISCGLDFGESFAKYISLWALKMIQFNSPYDTKKQLTDVAFAVICLLIISNAFFEIIYTSNYQS